MHSSGRHSCKHKWTTNPDSNPSKFTRGGGEAWREREVWEGADLWKEEEERGGVACSRRVTETEQRTRKKLRDREESTEQRWGPITDTELVGRTEINTEQKKRKRKWVKVDREQGGRGQGDTKWWRPETFFTGRLFFPVACSRHDSGHWTVLKLARGTTRDNGSAASCCGSAWLDAARQLIYHWWSVWQCVCDSVCVRGFLWVCVELRAMGATIPPVMKWHLAGRSFVCWCGSAVLGWKSESGIQSCLWGKEWVCVFTVPIAKMSQGESAACDVCLC